MEPVKIRKISQIQNRIACFFIPEFNVNLSNFEY